MTTLVERYNEILELLDVGIDLDEFVHGGSMEDYTMMAAEILGFKNPTLALSLDIDLAILIEFYGDRVR